MGHHLNTAPMRLFRLCVWERDWDCERGRWCWSVCRLFRTRQLGTALGLSVLGQWTLSHPAHHHRPFSLPPFTPLPPALFLIHLLFLWGFIKPAHSLFFWLCTMTSGDLLQCLHPDVPVMTQAVTRLSGVSLRKGTWAHLAGVKHEIRPDLINWKCYVPISQININNLKCILYTVLVWYFTEWHFPDPLHIWY